MTKSSEKNENMATVFTKKNSKPVETDKYIFRTLYLSMPANLKPKALIYLSNIFGFQSTVSVYSLIRIQKNEDRDLTAFQFLSLCEFFRVTPDQAVRNVEIPQLNYEMDFFAYVTNDKLTA